VLGLVPVVSCRPLPGCRPYQRLFPTRGAAALALFVCVLAPASLVGLQIDRNPRFSPVDEAAHLDYVNRVADGEIPRQGQRLQESTLREIACRGNALEVMKVPPCTSRRLRPDQFGGAFQHEAQQPPTYYALTVPGRWVAEHVLGIESRLVATRVVGVVWLVAGLLLLWAAGRVMDVDPLALSAALLLLVAAPRVVFFTSTVSNDATAVPAAGVVALSAALAYGRDAPFVRIALFAAGFFAAACKATNLLPVVAVSALFGVAAIYGRAPAQRWSAVLRRWLRDGGALLLGGVIAAGAWVLVHRTLALIDLKDEPTFRDLRSNPHGLDEVLRQAATFFQPLTDDLAVAVVSSATLGQDVQQPLHATLSFLLMGSALAGLFVVPRRWPHVLGLISVPLLYAGGAAFGLAVVRTYGTNPGLSGRYALSLAPLLIIALAASLQGTWPVRAVAVFAVVSFVTTFAVMLT
jgi:hypothetical protein